MMRCKVGEAVGYQVRFEDQTNKNTDITFMTDGILLRKIQYDPLLTEFSIIMVDEAHERSLNIDLCLGLLKDVNYSRYEVGMEPLRLVVTSATIERNKFAEYIGNGDLENSVQIEGKMFPVKVFYESEVPWRYDFTQAAADKVKGIVDRDLDGDILIFMPGKKEINLTVEAIKSQAYSSQIEIIPLHSELSPEEQDRIFKNSDKRKVVVSTNIAETSVTIEGIVHVIDSGYIKQNHFDPKTGIEQLVLIEHALSGLEQRKGRAGRVAPGYCYRLFTEESLKRRPKYPTPEIERSNLGQIVLAMKKVGIHDIENFDFIDPPNRNSIKKALNSLTVLGALDQSGNLTQIGEFMIDLGLEPRLARMVIEATKQGNGSLGDICTIASFLDGKNIFLRSEDQEIQKDIDRIHSRFKREVVSDFNIILNIWSSYVDSGYSLDWAKANFLNDKTLEEAKNLRLEILDVLKSRNIQVDEKNKGKISSEAFGKSITAGLIENLMVSSGKYAFKKVDDTKEDIRIHPSSLFSNQSLGHNALLISSEIFINAQGRAYASDCLWVKQAWLEEIAPHLLPKINFHPRNKNIFRRSHKHRH